MLHIQQAHIFSDIDENAQKITKAKYGLRRANRFTVLATTAVNLTFPDAFPNFLPENTGLITASALGPYKTGFATVDDILDFPEDQILPTKFSHSVHNCAAAYLGNIMNLHGPVFAISNIEAPLFEALELTDTILNAHICTQILLVAIEERGLLTQSLTRFWPERFPYEIQEAAAVFLASTTPTPDSFNIQLNRTSNTPAKWDTPFQLPKAFIDDINSHKSSTYTLI